MIARIANYIERSAKRSLKHAIQYFNSTSKQSKPIFVLGSQRSGTNMLMKLLDRIPCTRTYNEDNYHAFLKSPISEKMRLRPWPVILNLLKSPAKLTIFKSIKDSQLAIELLSTFPDSKIIWIYRDFKDVADSASKKWQGTAQRHIIRHIAEKGDDWNRWYCQNISKEDREFIKSRYHDKISELECAILKWYLRNRLFFQLNLQSNDHVLLINYSSLIQNPDKHLVLIQKFLNLKPIKKSYLDHLFDSSINKSINLSEVSPETLSAAKGLLNNLQNESEEQLQNRA